MQDRCKGALAGLERRAAGRKRLPDSRRSRQWRHLPARPLFPDACGHGRGSNLSMPPAHDGDRKASAGRAAGDGNGTWRDLRLPDPYLQPAARLQNTPRHRSCRCALYSRRSRPGREVGGAPRQPRLQDRHLLARQSRPEDRHGAFGSAFGFCAAGRDPGCAAHQPAERVRHGANRYVRGESGNPRRRFRRLARTHSWTPRR